jgi:hypothetical protein
VTRKISHVGLLFAMSAALGGSAPLPEPSLYRAPETRGRAAPTPPQPVERVKTQRVQDAEAKRARRRERNLRHAAKAVPPVTAKKGSICDAPCAWRAPVSPAGDYLDDNYFEGVDFKEVPATSAPLPTALTPNQQALLTHLEGGHDRPVSEILPYFPTPQSARATIAAAVKVGLVEVLGVLIHITPFGVVSLTAAR